MDRVVIHQKLESLRRCLARILSKQPISLGMLQKDYDQQDIVSLNLTRAVQMALNIVCSILQGHLQDFDAFAKAIDLKFNP